MDKSKKMNGLEDIRLEIYVLKSRLENLGRFIKRQEVLLNQLEENTQNLFSDLTKKHSSCDEIMLKFFSKGKLPKILNR